MSIKESYSTYITAKPEIIRFLNQFESTEIGIVYGTKGQGDSRSLFNVPVHIQRLAIYIEMGLLSVEDATEAALHPEIRETIDAMVSLMF